MRRQPCEPDKRLLKQIKLAAAVAVQGKGQDLAAKLLRARELDRREQRGQARLRVSVAQARKVGALDRDRDRVVRWQLGEGEGIPRTKNRSAYVLSR